MTYSLRGACRALTVLAMTLGIAGAGLVGPISIVSAPASADTSTQGDTPNGGQPAQLSGPIQPADAAYPIAGAWGPSLKAAGYEQREYFASGTAYSYQATGPENNAERGRSLPLPARVIALESWCTCRQIHRSSTGQWSWSG